MDNSESEYKQIGQSQLWNDGAAVVANNESEDSFMALFTPGPAVGQISGRIGGSVFSHNRGGQYIRNGSIPVNTPSLYRDRVKAILGAMSQVWNTLSEEQRAAWNEFATSRTWKNRLGRSISLNGQQTFIQLSARITDVGGTVANLPPVTAAPFPIGNVTFTSDIGAGDFSLAWTSGALGANDRLYLRGCVVGSQSITNVKNLFRNFYISAPAATTPEDIQADAIARFGTLQVGQTFWLEYRTVDEVTGLESAVFTLSSVIVST